MQVDIWADIVCPWCYIGEARFSTALARFAATGAVTITHHAFELDPRPHDGTVPVRDMLARKYRMTPEQADAAEDRVRDAARDEGLDYRVDRSVGNTLYAHRLVKLAERDGSAEAMVRRLFRANFAEARSVFDIEALAELGAEVGLEPDVVRETLAGEDFIAEVREDEDEAGELGISGVPFILVDRRFAIGGAQPVDVMVEVLERAAARTAAGR